jgi:hypothetical protein
MLAIKENKQLQIEEKEKTYYLTLGYDIAEVVEGELKIIENTPSKTVTYAIHKEALDKIAELEKENEVLKLSAMTVEQLKAYAADRKVDLGDATTKEAILLKFKEPK